MKNTGIIILLSVIAFSCSNPNVLTKSSAEDIINECMKKENLFETIPIELGKDVHLTKKEAEIAKGLDEKGLVNFTEVNNEYGGIVNNIELTEKGKSLVVKQEQGKYDKLVSTNDIERFKSCEYRVEEILEIQEIPAYNMAKVKVKFKKTDETDIYFLDPNETEFWTAEIGLKKTTDGWKYCD